MGEINLVFQSPFFPSWKYCIRRNVNVYIAVVTMRRVAKIFHANILIVRHFMIISLLKKSCLIATVSNTNRIV